MNQHFVFPTFTLAGSTSRLVFIKRLNDLFGAFDSIGSHFQLKVTLRRRLIVDPFEVGFIEHH